ncbi:DUF4175 family protein [Abyssalbus ytuae]|uniref:Uncharacterized protein n=1 Tax=Abyssalbus ytuae TaxID=2926907 RepID=A0A9E7D4U7_9FLAO|nr:DUF4175 family protein [Abyssalbus ytuae]UOB19329.1 hypothetical protein MQE35_08520 [Abyssalbus ytuae]
MSHFEQIKHKLEQFIRKYYTNELLKGAILFFSIGLLYFLFTLLVEHFLWLNQTGRSILFWLFIIVEVALFIKFIVIPLARLFKLQKGISYKEASQIIGNHFPEVNDKLLNVLQLSENKEQSELLLAGIEQKSGELQPVPFQFAIDFKNSLKYAKYAVIPLIIILVAVIFNKTNWFSDSYKRVVNYDLAYEPPAPFQFFIINNNLNAIENQPFKLEVNTAGSVIPEETTIHIGDETYYLQNKGEGFFEYIFAQPKEEVEFYISANNIKSKPYKLNVIKVPGLLNFEMLLNYPNYTKKRNEVLKNTGNAVVPEGTTITWKLNTKQTSKVEFIEKDTTLEFTAQNNNFNLTRRLYNSIDYHISTSNNDLKNYENLGFSISIIRDGYPEIDVKSARDSINNLVIYFLGQVSDDYGLSKLQLVYYPVGNENDKKIHSLKLNKSNFDQFTYAFPSNLSLIEGEEYAFYFEVFDNDALRRGKSTKTGVFNYRKLTQSELEQQQLQQQSETIQDLNKSLDKIEKGKKELEEISRTNKEKEQLSFNDKRKLENFLKRQQQQEQMMKKFNDQLQKNLEDFQKEEEQDDEYKKLLKERLERQQKEMEKNEKLMEQMKEISDKLKKEELSKKLEELAKQQQNNQRSLEQILELTKRYYVSAKAEKIQTDLEELSKKQEELSQKEGEENNKQQQEELNKSFEDLQKQMDELQNENEQLKKPMDIKQDKNSENKIKEQQQQASENLDKKENPESSEEEKKESEQKARQNQKSAAQKMRQMSKNMKSNMQMGGAQAIMEDAEMLRQILDNLIVYSFDQEELMNKFENADNNNPNYSKNLKKQHELRELFEHVDDSLFSLSLRRPEISENINKNITDVFYNIDKSLEYFAENQIYQGVGSQQYALTAANELASFLSDALDNLQENLGSGQGGGGQDFQLPDIIQSQEELNQLMQQGMQQGQGQKPEEQQGEGQQSEGNNEGDSKSDGGKQKNQNNGKEKGEGKESSDNSEQMSEQLYEIYKQQQLLRQMLEKQIEDKKGRGEVGNAERLVKEMEKIENDLLEYGFNERTLQRMTNLKHQLLKLKEASFEQGEKQERESKTNQQQYNNSTNNTTPDIQQYFNQVEILNRQVLPLRQIYKRKVQEYFKNDD